MEYQRVKATAISATHSEPHIEHAAGDDGALAVDGPSATPVAEESGEHAGWFPFDGDEKPAAVEATASDAAQKIADRHTPAADFGVFQNQSVLEHAPEQASTASTTTAPAQRWVSMRRLSVKAALAVGGSLTLVNAGMLIGWATNTPARAPAANSSTADAKTLSEDAKSYLGRGQAWSDLKEYDRAIEDFDEAIRLNPTNALAFYNRGSAWSAKKEYHKALRDYGDAIRLDPEHAAAFSKRGVLWSSKKEYDKAIADFDQAIRLDPKNALAFHERGTALSAKKEYGKAMMDYDAAIRLDPSFAAAYNSRGSAWLRKQETDQAIRDLGEAIRLDPNYALALTNRGSAWRMKKEYESALKDFDQAIRLDPKSALAHHHRGSLWAARKEYDKALTDYETAIRLDPNDAPAYNSRGDAWLRKKEIDRAIQDFSAAIRLDPNYVLALTNRGLAWRMKKEYESALKDFDQAIGLDPTNPLALANRKQLEAERQEQRRSLAIARERTDGSNRAIFAEAKEFVDSHPRIELPGAGLSSWQLVTRPFRNKTSLSRVEHEQMLSFLERAMLHAQHDPDMPIRPVAFRQVIETLRKWDFRYSD